MSNHMYTSCNVQAQQPVSNLVCLISKRNSVYKAGLAISSISFILFFFGDAGMYSVNSALFLGKIFFFVCLASYCFTIGVAVYENTRKVDPYTYYSRRFEICLFITGIVCTSIVAVLRTTELVPLWSFWSLIIALLSIACLWISFFLVLCGNKKTFPEPIVHTVQFTTGAVHNTAMHHSYGMPMLAHQYTVQSQPLLSHCVVVPQSAPPPYSLPPSYPASYHTSVVPGYSYLPPAPLAVPTAPMHNTQQYCPSSYGMPQPITAQFNPIVPSAPQLDDKD